MLRITTCSTRNHRDTTQETLTYLLTPLALYYYYFLFPCNFLNKTGTRDLHVVSLPRVLRSLLKVSLRLVLFRMIAVFESVMRAMQRGCVQHP